MRGGLIREIMFPRPIISKFTKQTLRFLLFLAFIAFFGFCYSLYLMVCSVSNVFRANANYRYTLYTSSKFRYNLYCVFIIVDSTRSPNKATHHSPTRCHYNCGASCASCSVDRRHHVRPVSTRRQINFLYCPRSDIRCGLY